MTIDDLTGLRGKSVLLIGGGEGIGAGCARCLAAAGCDIVIVDISEVAATHVQAIVRSAGAICEILIADALDPGNAPDILAAARALLGRPTDILVPVVGQANWRPALDLTIDDWDEEQRRNTRYIFALAQALAVEMVRESRRGSIVAISSVSGLQSAPRHAAYGAAKAGLINLVRSLAVEFAPYGIRVNSVAPGVTATPRVRAMAEQSAAVAEGVGRVPFGRFAEPDEIGKAVLFLASDLASYVTGQTLAVDGGATARFAFD